MSWARGEDTVRRLLAEGRLESVTGGAADGTHWLESAAALLESAVGRSPAIPRLPTCSPTTPHARPVPLCSPYRVCEPGLPVIASPSSKSYAPSSPGPFNGFATLRRRRTEVEYPQRPGNEVATAEAEDAVATSREILSAADGVIIQLTLFR